LLAPLDDPASHRTLRAERAVLAELGGSCTAPVAAWAEALADPAGHLRVHGLVASGDGRTVVQVEETGKEPEAVGAAVARALLVDAGGTSIDGFAVT
jgi:hydroxymethylbilane synthase